MKTALFMFLLSSPFICLAQPKKDSVDAQIFVDKADNNYAIFSVIIKPNQNSATVFFSLTSDEYTYGVYGFNGTEDSVGYRFRINGLQCRQSYELNWSAYTNNDLNVLCGQGKLKFKAGACPPPNSVADKKKKR